MPKDMKFIKIDCEIIQWRCWKASFVGRSGGGGIFGWGFPCTCVVVWFSSIGCWTLRSDVVCRIFCRV